jgi:hypothetical protein
MSLQRKFAAFVLAIASIVSLSQCRSSDVSSKSAALPPGIDLTNAQMVEVRNTTGDVVLSGTFADHKATLASSDPNATAKGAAELEVEHNGAKQEIEASVEGLPPSTPFKLMVDGKEVATFTTTDGGKQSLKYQRSGS